MAFQLDAHILILISLVAMWLRICVGAALVFVYALDAMRGEKLRIVNCDYTHSFALHWNDFNENGLNRMGFAISMCT